MKIEGNALLIFDGGIGTMLQEKGLQPGSPPELWNLSHPDVIAGILREYREAGAMVLTSNTFGASRYKLGDQVAQVIEAGVSLAKEAAQGKAYVALDMGPTGKLLQPLGDLPFEDAVEAFAQMVKAGAAAGADCVLIETMTDIYEAKAAVLAAKEHCSLPVFVSMTYDQAGKLLTGGNLEVAAAVLEGLGVDAIGINCGLGPKQMIALTAQLRKLTALPIFVQPNAGLPRVENGRTLYDVGPGEFARDLEEIVAAGAWAVGGCCGTTPAHIAAVKERCAALPLSPIPEIHRTVISSGMRSVMFGETPVLIGERINPTGKSRFKQALREHDIPYLLREGIAQEEAGAHVLDVNVGLPEIDEAGVLCETIRELQAICPLPLQIDTADPAAMEQAMRLYNGKPLVNSVTAKQASMSAIFPLVKKYGGVVIGLTITEEGIPETAQGRLEAARRIVETAAGYGISRENIVIDPLTMAVSAQGDAAQITLDSLSLIRRELGVCTSLGVSNVSFGLPQREQITSAFFLTALNLGLDAAIMNPLSPGMMSVYRSHLVLTGQDENCVGYIEAYAGQQSAPPSSAAQKDSPSLAHAVEKGLKEAAYAAAKQLMAQGKTGLEVIDGAIVPALDVVGEQFEKKTLFLPQLLMSAEAAKAAFEAVKEQLSASGETGDGGMKIVLATVKGDVHDIGKNIVKVLLENYGFRVFDLGKDVPPEAVLDAVQREQAPLVGLSALMTTTVPAMKETIQLLHEQAPGVKIMVGGAVLTQEYADAIGADFYGKDAMASVRYASSLKE